MASPELRKFVVYDRKGWQSIKSGRSDQKKQPGEGGSSISDFLGVS
jgi:hypothetical protein